MSAFLKLRALDAGAARVPAGVRRAGPADGALLVHRAAPALGPALVARRRRRSLRARRRRRVAAPWPLQAGRWAGRRGRAVRSRAARSATSAMTSCAPSSRSGEPNPDHAAAAGHGADAVRPARRLRPPEAHGHDPRKRRPRRRAGHRARLRGRGEHDRRGARTAGGPGAARGAWPDGAVRARQGDAELPVEHAARASSKAMVARIVRVHPRGRRLSGGALAALVGRGAGAAVLDLPGPARGQPEPVHVLPRLRRLPGRRAPARSRC